MQAGGVVLCGGRSSRMRWPKALLPFGPECLLQRVVRLLSSAVQPVVVVAAEGQRLPVLPDTVRVVRDRRRGYGPLEGLAVGLAAIREQAAAAFVTGCDVPLLVPDFVRELVRRLEAGIRDQPVCCHSALPSTRCGSTALVAARPPYDVVVPVEGDRHHPLAAAYRTAVLPEIEKLLAARRLRPVFLYDSVRTERVPVADLRAVDPNLRTLANLNHAVDYLSALAEAGLDLPEELRTIFEEIASAP